MMSQMPVQDFYYGNSWGSGKPDYRKRFLCLKSLKHNMPFLPLCVGFRNTNNYLLRQHLLRIQKLKK